MSIFSKFFEMVRKWFRPSRALPAATTFVEESINDATDSNEVKNAVANTSVTSEASTTSEDRINFVNEIKVKKMEATPELLDLQSKFESNQIELKDLTDEQLDDLNDLYQMQIEELRQKINSTKSEININMSKLESASLSA